MALFTRLSLSISLITLLLSDFSMGALDYATALEKSILFYEGQRSGKLPESQRISWRGDSGLNDGSSSHVNLEGGYYDAGDNVKFGLPMAFTSTMLAWSIIEFGTEMGEQIDNAKDALKWGTDYLLKAATATPNTLYVQDELLWGASWIHRASGKASYMSYIQSNGQTLGANDDDFSFSWDDKRAGTKILLSKDFLERRTQQFEVYKAHSDNYICSLIPGSNSFQAQYTPGGLFYKQSDSNLQYVTSTTFLLLTYAKYLRTTSESVTCGGSPVSSESLISWAKKQVDYILGDNPTKTSFMVGFGEKYPLHVHHRGSSLPSIQTHPSKIGCNDGFQYFHSESPNPNVLVGAVLGGPDYSDGFSDDRNNYRQSEPATYINAPFVGALAFFKAENGGY